MNICIVATTILLLPAASAATPYPVTVTDMDGQKLRWKKSLSM